jgi:cytosine/adenosine deaminase-related metal-dependent hydrolase
MHPQLKTGVLSAGYRANILIFDVDHPAFWPRADLLRALCFSDTGSAIWGMMVNGEWIGRRGEYHQSILSSPEYRETLSEADERLRALLDRI